LPIEFLLSVCLVLAFVGIVEWVVGRSTFACVISGNRQAIYGSIASVAGSLLGFVITAVSVVLALAQERQMRVLRDSGRIHDVFDINFQAITWLGAATVWAFVGLVADTDKNPAFWATYVMMWLSILVFFRVIRCIWILKVITRKIVASGVGDPASSQA